MDNIDTPDNDSSRTRSFWIQGRSGPHWQNLENIAESQTAILRLGELVSQDRYDELKLLESRFSPITGETDYYHVVTIRDRQVIEHPEPGAPVQNEITNQIVVPEGQMALWEDQEASANDQQSDFWKIEGTASGAPETAKQNPDQNEPFLNRPSSHGDFGTDRSENSNAPTEANSPQDAVTNLLAGLTERRAQRRANQQVPYRQGQSVNQRKPVNRGVLLSGALAGAFAVGLVIAAMDPKSASTMYQALLHEIPSTQPTMTIDLASAVSSNNPQTIRQALLAGADPNQRDENGIPVLLKAARHGLPITVNLLLQAGADPVVPVTNGRSVLHLTASEGLAEPLKLMLRSGAEPDLAGGSYGCLTPLGLAAANGHIRSAKVLTDFNASLDPLPGCDVSPLEMASAYPVLRSRLEATAAARRSVAAVDPAVIETPSTTVSLPLSLDVPEPKSVDLVPTPVAVAVSLPVAVKTAAMEPDAPIVVSTFQPEQTVLPEPVNLASLAPQSTLEVAALTTVSPATVSPRAPTRPLSNPDSIGSEQASSITSDIQLDVELARLIQLEGAGALEAVLEHHKGTIDLASLEIPIIDNGDVHFQNPVDYAVLSGKLSHAQALINAGGLASMNLLHAVVDRQSEGQLHPALHFLLKNDAETNTQLDGMTPLMRAAKNRDDRTTTLLLAYGANPGVVSDTGLKAADFAANSKSIDIQEKLVIAEFSDDYNRLMFGLTWYDTLDKVQSKTETCKSVSDGFVACKLAVPAWLEDTSAIIAQFDTHNGDRLVALQIDSKLYSNELEARKNFDDAVLKIDELLPAGQQGFTVQELARGMPFFESLKPSVNASNFYQYWPDEDRAKPVYLHLKMIGHTTRQGFHRLIIGNPFRIG